VGGANVKTHSEDRDDIHAEGMVLDRIRRFGDDIIGVPLLAVVGDLQPDQATGLATRTLHPCSKCRNMLADNRDLFDLTTIVTATPALDVCQVFSLNSLRSYYAREIAEPKPYQLEDINLQLAVLALGDQLAQNFYQNELKSCSRNS